MSSILKKLNKKSLIVLTGLCLILLFTIFNITKKDKLKEIKTVELLSGNRNYEEQEEGAWNLEKSAKWTGFHKAQIEFNFDSIAKQVATMKMFYSLLMYQVVWGEIN